MTQTLSRKVLSISCLKVRYDKSFGSETALKFMTDGILLREAQSDFLLRKYSCLIIDEAHERSLNTDLLIGDTSLCLTNLAVTDVSQARNSASGYCSDFVLKGISAAMICKLVFRVECSQYKIC